nr:hypothetical protein BaRGS_022691 [Batillaria attramentaria]
MLEMAPKGLEEGGGMKLDNPQPFVPLSTDGLCEMTDENFNSDIFSHSTNSRATKLGMLEDNRKSLRPFNDLLNDLTQAVKLVTDWFAARVRPHNYGVYLEDIFKQRVEMELGQPSPLADKTFFQLSYRQRVEVLQQLTDFRLDAEDVFELLKIQPGARYWYFYGTRLYREDPVPVVKPKEKKAAVRSGKKRGRPPLKKGKRKAVNRKKETPSSARGTPRSARLRAKMEAEAKAESGDDYDDDNCEEEEEEEDEEKTEEEDSEDETLSELRSQNETLDDAASQSKRKAARLRVNLEKAEDEGTDEEQEEEDVESIKFDDSSDDLNEDDDVLPEDTSDEDYSEKGTRKQRRGARGRRTKKTPKAEKTTKTPKSGRSRHSAVPQTLRHPPRSARLRAKFGLQLDEDSRDSLISTTEDDRISVSSHSTVRSDRPSRRGRGRGRKSRQVAGSEGAAETEENDTQKKQNDTSVMDTVSNDATAEEQKDEVDGATKDQNHDTNTAEGREESEDDPYAKLKKKEEETSLQEEGSRTAENEVAGQTKDAKEGVEQEKREITGANKDAQESIGQENVQEENDSIKRNDFQQEKPDEEMAASESPEAITDAGGNFAEKHDGKSAREDDKKDADECPENAEEEEMEAETIQQTVEVETIPLTVEVESVPQTKEVETISQTVAENEDNSADKAETESMEKAAASHASEEHCHEESNSGCSAEQPDTERERKTDDEDMEVEDKEGGCSEKSTVGETSTLDESSTVVEKSTVCEMDAVNEKSPATGGMCAGDEESTACETSAVDETHSADEKSNVEHKDEEMVIDGEGTGTADAVEKMDETVSDGVESAEGSLPVEEITKECEESSLAADVDGKDPASPEKRNPMKTEADGTAQEEKGDDEKDESDAGMSDGEGGMEADVSDSNSKAEGDAEKDPAVKCIKTENNVDEKGDRMDAADSDSSELSKSDIKKEENEDPENKTDAIMGRVLRSRYLKEPDTEDSRDSMDSLKERKKEPWEPRQPSEAGQKTGWHLVCEVVEDWQHLADSFHESTIRCERSLLKTICNDFLPEIPAIQDEKERERRRRQKEMAPRRISSRLLYKQKELEEQERILKEAAEEEERQKAQEEEERKKKMEEERLEEQRRLREERERAREERAKRVQLREERARLIAEGKEIPPELLNGLKSADGQGQETQILEEEVVAKLHKVLTALMKHHEAWPFVEPVDETYAPGYFDIIKTPMNLMEMENKLDAGKYASKEEFAEDMDLIVENSEAYNGVDSGFQ